MVFMCIANLVDLHNRTRPRAKDTKINAYLKKGLGIIESANGDFVCLATYQHDDNNQKPQRLRGNKK